MNLTEEDASRWNQAEQALLRLLDASTDGILIHVKSRIVYANPAMCRLLGLPSPRDLLGRSPLDIVAPAFRALEADRVFQTSIRRMVSSEIEERLLSANGKDIPVEVLAVPTLFDREAATLLHVRDIHERKDLALRLRAADRLATVGLLAAGIAHEINNPLTYALGNLELLAAQLEASPGLSDEARAMLDATRAGLEQAARVAQDVKVFFAPARAQPVPVDVHAVLDSCLSLVHVEARGRARLVKRYARIPPALGREARLAQVFLNLVHNALQAIPEGDEEAHQVEVSTSLAAPGSIAVEVRDDGPGIAPELREAIFEPFFTTKPRGTGLGLAICRTIVTEDGGTISLDSAVGSGSTFRVVLPAAAAAAEQSGPDGAEKHTSGAKILIIDDEPRLLALLRTILARHITTTATSAPEALAHLRSGQTFDLILSDLSMGDVGGPELYETIRAEWPGLEARIVFMTGGAFDERTATFLERVPNRRLDKPFRAQELLAAVDAALASLRPKPQA